MRYENNNDDSKNVNKIIDFFKLAGKLKQIARTGWVRRSIKNPESVAEHTYRVALMSAIIGDILNLDSEKMMKMALLHDLAESIIGDKTPQDINLIGTEQFRNRENKIMNDIISLLPENIREEYMRIWTEFKDESSEEGRVVREIDKLEMIFQALEYEQDGYSPNLLNEFWNSVKSKIKTPLIKKFYDNLEKIRKGYEI
ncbi:MAG: HD domain-containing protein [Candidatus Asgardarchaeia archaeon]